MKLGKKFLAGRLKSIWEQTNKTNVTQKEENAQQRNKAQEIWEYRIYGQAVLLDSPHELVTPQEK